MIFDAEGKEYWDLFWPIAIMLVLVVLVVVINNMDNNVHYMEDDVDWIHDRVSRCVPAYVRECNITILNSTHVQIICKQDA